MARITVEDCLEKVNNRFLIVQMAIKRVKQYHEGYEPLVSTDIVGNPHSSVFDSQLTSMNGPRMAKVLSWYDNEYGYSSRMVDVLCYMAEVGL